MTRAAGLLALALLCVAGEARAEEMHRSPHHESSEVLIGGKALGAIELALDDEQRETERGAGGALYLESSLVPGWLELELGVAWVASETERSATFEALFKKNFHLDERLDLYVGLGLAIGAHDRETGVIGALLALGAYVWLDEALGIDVDVSGRIGADGPRGTLELAVGLGPVLRM